jgi:lipopolysaccharide export system protein LptA
MLRPPLVLVFLAAVLAVPNAVLAQPSKGPPNALQGFSQNRNEPVHIEAATLEVRDKDKVATFSGNVRVKQGDTGLRCDSLLVFYEQNAVGDKTDKTAKGAKDVKTGAGKTMPAATPGPGGQQRIKRLEAHGHVVVTQKEQTATGDLGIFDMTTNTVTLSGHVTMTQDKNVLRGERLVVDLDTGVSRVESGKNRPVQGLFPTTGGMPDVKSAPGSKPGSKSHAPLSVRPFH